MKNILTLCIFLFPVISIAQKQNNIWYFGFNGGLDFSSGAPVSISGGQTQTLEGSASVCDTSGNLLFYTDGIDVWNNSHQQMPNGFGLYGNTSSTQAALIIPNPDSINLFYIFTTDAYGGGDGCRYSIVDMNQQNGLGDVTVKNTLLHSSTTEKLTACVQSNGHDYWVITHPLNSNQFEVYPVTSTGVGAPVVTAVGANHSGSSSYGEATYSCSNDKVAIHVRSNGTVELLDIDLSTGILSNPIVINNFSGSGYGLEIAPGGAMLYVTTWNTQQLYQYDISSNDETTINNSIQTIATSAYPLGTIQLATDGKLYMTDYGTSTLAVINNPDTYGSSCNFNDEAIDIGNNIAYYGLQNYPLCMNTQGALPLANFSASDSIICTGCIDFSDLSFNNPFSWQWFFTGGTPGTSTDQNPTGICYSMPGSYDVTMVVSNAFGSDTMILSNFITVVPDPSPFLTLNGNIITSSAATSYQWDFNGSIITGATDQSYTATQSGSYSVTVTDTNGCSGSASIDIQLTQFSSPDTIICEKFCADFFDQSLSNPTSWLWLFPGGSPSGSSSQNPVNICYNTPGTYDVTLITTNAFGNDTLMLQNFITVVATPSIPVITQTGYTFTSSPATGYQWQFNSVDIPGATNQSYTVTQTGFYSVVISDEEGCVSASVPVYVLISGLNDISSMENISVQNLSAGIFNIIFENVEQGELNIRVFNCLGQLIFSSVETVPMSPFKKEINLTPQPGGVYFLQVREGNRERVMKLVKH